MPRRVRPNDVRQLAPLVMTGTRFREGRAFLEMLFITVDPLVAIAKNGEVLADPGARGYFEVRIHAGVPILASTRVGKMNTQRCPVGRGFMR
jgi:hypothetical protein